MTDKDHKVIELFTRHKRGEKVHLPGDEGGEMCVTPDGYHYISFKNTWNGHPLDEESLKSFAREQHYVIKLQEHHSSGCRLDHYYVTGENLEAFLRTLPHRPGTLLGIQAFFPDSPA
jgi:hypothetical protein